MTKSIVKPIITLILRYVLNNRNLLLISLDMKYEVRHGLAMTTGSHL